MIRVNAITAKLVPDFIDELFRKLTATRRRRIPVPPMRSMVFRLEVRTKPKGLIVIPMVTQPTTSGCLIVCNARPASAIINAVNVNTSIIGFMYIPIPLRQDFHCGIRRGWVSTGSDHLFWYFSGVGYFLRLENINKLILCHPPICNRALKKHLKFGY